MFVQEIIFLRPAASRQAGVLGRDARLRTIYLFFNLRGRSRIPKLIGRRERIGVLDGKRKMSRLDVHFKRPPEGFQEEP